MLYRRVELHEGTPVQYLGVYALKWGQVDEPQCGFVEAELADIVPADTVMEAEQEKFLIDIERIQDSINAAAATVGQQKQTILIIRLNTIIACISGLNALARRLVQEGEGRCT